MHSSIILSVHPGFCVVVAFSLFIFPPQWVLGWLIAAAIHELFHILMIYTLKIRIYSVAVRSTGAQIETESMTTQQELLCAIAGPLGGLLTFFLMNGVPQIALCAIVQTVYNLIPVYPLDGGRAFKSAVACIWNEECSESVSKAVSVFIVLLIIVLGIYFSYRHRTGLLPTIVLFAPMTLSICKNSLQSRKNNSTMLKMH